MSEELVNTIYTPDTKRTKFSTLRVGQIFEAVGTVYIRTPLSDGNNACKLSNGVMRFIHGDTYVTQLDEITIRRFVP